MSRYAPISAGMGLGATHPLDAFNFYYSDGSDDPELANERKRVIATRARRKAGMKPFAQSLFRTQNPPCLKCEFHDVCKSRALACNVFAEWAISRRPVPKDIKRLLPSKKWMALLSQSDTLDPIRVAYYSIVNKQTGEVK